MTSPAPAASARRGVKVAGALGNAVEWYDFAVLGASATLVAQALTPGGSSGMTAVFLVFGLSFVVRPVGSMIGARWADRAGRRRPLIVSWVTMTVVTAAIGVLPPWSVGGSAVFVALMLLRVTQGLSAGAELVVSVAYLVEHAPSDRRGLSGGVHMATMALGFAGGTAAVWAVSAALPADALSAWGWRLPFLAALPLGLVAIVVRNRLVETPTHRELRSTVTSVVWRHPLRALAPERATVARGFLLTAGFTSSFSLWFVYLPAHLAGSDVVSLPTALTAATSGLLAIAGSAVILGGASDTLGRRPVVLVGLVVVMLSWLIAFPALVHGASQLFIPASILMGTGLGAVLLQSVLAEAFTASLRTVGIAVTVGIANALVGGTAPLVGDALGRVAPLLPAGYALSLLLLSAWGALTLSAHPTVAPSTRVALPGRSPSWGRTPPESHPQVVDQMVDQRPD